MLYNTAIAHDNMTHLASIVDYTQISLVSQLSRLLEFRMGAKFLDNLLHKTFISGFGEPAFFIQQGQDTWRIGLKARKRTLISECSFICVLCGFQANSTPLNSIFFFALIFQLWISLFLEWGLNSELCSIISKVGCMNSTLYVHTMVLNINTNTDFFRYIFEWLAIKVAKHCVVYKCESLLHSAFFFYCFIPCWGSVSSLSVLTGSKGKSPQKGHSQF